MQVLGDYIEFAEHVWVLGLIDCVRVAIIVMEPGIQNGVLPAAVVRVVGSAVHSVDGPETATMRSTGSVQYSISIHGALGYTHIWPPMELSPSSLAYLGIL